MDLVLRKRVSLNIYKRQSITERLKKSKWLGRADYAINQTGVTYEVVSNIPKASEELEDRESLAQLAASGDDSSANDGETYIGRRQVAIKLQRILLLIVLVCPFRFRKIHTRCVSRRKYSDIGSFTTKCCHQRIGTNPRTTIVNA